MSTDLITLVVVIVALYLSECVVFARHGAVVLTAPFFFGGGRFHVLSRALGTAKGAFTILNPLPPFGRVYVVEPWPFSPSQEGVVALRSFALAHEPRPLQSARKLAWAQIEKVGVDERAVVVNGEVFAQTSSPRHARAAADVLEQLRAAKPAQRKKLLEDLVAASLDPDVVRLRLKRHATWGLPLALFSSWLFVILFLWIPRVLKADGLAHWPVLVIVAYAGVLLCAFATWIAHKKLLPAATGDRWGQVILMLPAPMMAMRGNDKLGRWLLAGSHPVAVALASFDGSLLDDVVGRALRDLAHPREPVLPHDDAEAAAWEAEHRARVLTQAKRRAKMAGLDVDALLGPPKLGAGQVAYCPRCRVPYRQTGVCADCAVRLATP
jgi:hypothetical protein